MDSATVYDYMSLATMERIAADHSNHWFDPASMRFFNSRVCETTIRQSPADPYLWYFVSSERCDWGDGHPRRYSVRVFDTRTGSTDTVGEFQAYASRTGAEGAILRLCGVKRPRPERVCEVCGANLFRKSTWERHGKRLICMSCGPQGYTFFHGGIGLRVRQRAEEPAAV